MAWYEVYERDVLGKPGAARYGHTPSPVFRAAAQRLSGARVVPEEKLDDTPTVPEREDPPAVVDLRRGTLVLGEPSPDAVHTAGWAELSHRLLEFGEACSLGSDSASTLQFPRQPSMRGPAQYARFEIEQRQPDPLSEFTRDWTIPGYVLLRSLPRDLVSGLWEMACGLASGVRDWITGGKK